MKCDQFVQNTNGRSLLVNGKIWLGSCFCELKGGCFFLLIFSSSSHCYQFCYPGRMFFCNLIFSRADVCESKVEIVTPYWASNSNGKVGI